MILTSGRNTWFQRQKRETWRDELLQFTDDGQECWNVHLQLTTPHVNLSNPNCSLTFKFIKILLPESQLKNHRFESLYNDRKSKLVKYDHNQPSWDSLQFPTSISEITFEKKALKKAATIHSNVNEKYIGTIHLKLDQSNFWHYGLVSIFFLSPVNSFPKYKSITQCFSITVYSTTCNWKPHDGGLDDDLQLLYKDVACALTSCWCWPTFRGWRFPSNCEPF